ncbi:cyclin-like protein [Rhodotorula toruloides]
MVDPDDWILQLCDEDEAVESERLIEEIKREFKEEIDYFDISMVAEYSDEIFEYMAELEEASMPNPRYMDHQSEIEWPMRATLIDWLLQVHMRYHMLPETLWIAVNIIDRFLSNRVVSLVKFQLVGVTAMFIASKYEEIMAPSVEEFVLMTENGYSREEILKGERIILQSLEFNISTYCSPYSWVRRISKADDYDIQTRTLSKFLMEVTLLDHRFLRARPSMIAAIGMYLARRMLGGDWNEAFIFYSGYTEAQLLVPAGFLLESIAAPGFEEKFCYKKYSSKKFLKASIFARNWAKQNAATEAA